MAAWQNFVTHMRRYCAIYSGAGISIVVAVSMTPQTVFLGRNRKILAHMRGEKEQPLDDNTKNLTTKVLERILLKAEEEADLEFFTCYASDPLHRGSVKMRFGAVIGLPATFAYRDTSDINKNELLIGQTPVKWESAHGVALANSLVLSDKAKAFAIARELNYVSFHQSHAEVTMRSIFGTMAYLSGYSLNRVFHLQRNLRPWARFSVYSTITCAWFLLYVAVSDAYHCWQDNSADRRAASLGKAYADGGLEFYSKMLSRNQALRALLGPNGPTQYTAYGNVVSTWRRPEVQLTTRRDNLQKIVASLQQ